MTSSLESKLPWNTDDADDSHYEQGRISENSLKELHCLIVSKSNLAGQHLLFFSLFGTKLRSFFLSGTPTNLVVGSNFDFLPQFPNFHAQHILMDLRELANGPSQYHSIFLNGAEAQLRHGSFESSLFRNCFGRKALWRYIIIV